MIKNPTYYLVLKIGLLLLFVGGLIFAASNVAMATIYNVINTNDGSIADWNSIPDAHSQTDASGDIPEPALDIVKGWAIRGLNQYANPAEDQLLFRIQTNGTLGQYMAVGAALDCNNNGSFTDAGDRIIVHMNDCPAQTPGEKNAMLPGDQIVSMPTALGPDIGEGIGNDNEIGVLVTNLPNPCGAPNGDLMIKFLTADAELWCRLPFSGPATEIDATQPDTPMSGINVPTAVDMVELKINLNSNPHQPTIIALIIAAVGLVGLVTITVIRRNYLKNN